MVKNALKSVAGVLLGLMIVATGAFAFTVSTSVLNLTINQETVQADSTVNATSQGFSVTLGGAGNGAAPGSAVEASSLNPSLQSALTLGHYAYTLTVVETGIAAWNSSTTYTATVYGDGTLLATLYFKNATANDLAVEGVTIKVDVGSTSTIPDRMDVQLQKTN